MGLAPVVRQRGSGEGSKRKAAKKRSSARVLTATVGKGEASLPVTPPAVSRLSSKSRISSKGQITLPLQVRERLGVRGGDQVEFFFDGERTIVRPVRSEEDPFAKWVGIAKNVPAGFNPIAHQREMRGWDAWDHEQYG